MYEAAAFPTTLRRPSAAGPAGSHDISITSPGRTFTSTLELRHQSIRTKISCEPGGTGSVTVRPRFTLAAISPSIITWYLRKMSRVAPRSRRTTIIAPSPEESTLAHRSLPACPAGGKCQPPSALCALASSLSIRRGGGISHLGLLNHIVDASPHVPQTTPTTATTATPARKPPGFSPGLRIAARTMTKAADARINGWTAIDRGAPIAARRPSAPQARPFPPVQSTEYCASCAELASRA